MRVVVIFRFWTICKSHWHHAGRDKGHCKLYHPYWPTATVNTLWSVSTSQVALRVIILHTCFVRTSGEGVLEEWLMRPHRARMSDDTMEMLACNSGI